MRRLIRGVLAAISAILAVTALLLVTQEVDNEAAYRRLGEQNNESSAENGVLKRDWNQILNENEEAVGWITVEGTSIDYPVVQPTGPTESNYYLSHNFWKQVDAAGCPYLDARTNVTDTHMMIFGHRLGPTNRMFGSLSGIWKQKLFESIGTARFETPDQDFAFSPLCALKVDCEFSHIQRFDFKSDEELRSWLSGLVHRASARHAEADDLVARAKRSLTLVTCASSRSGSRERTLVIFVSNA